MGGFDEEWPVVGVSCLDENILIAENRGNIVVVVRYFAFLSRFFVLHVHLFFMGFAFLRLEADGGAFRVAALRNRDDPQAGAARDAYLAGVHVVSVIEDQGVARGEALEVAGELDVELDVAFIFDVFQQKAARPALRLCLVGEEHHAEHQDGCDGNAGHHEQPSRLNDVAKAQPVGNFKTFENHAVDHRL